MRKQPTRSESDLWFHLRRKNLGYQFYRQSLQRGYILDFYCPELRLAIEVDGSVHDRPDVLAKDKAKEKALIAAGIVVLRFVNEDVLNFPSVVLTRIIDECKRRNALKAVASALSGEGERDSSSNRRGAGKKQALLNSSVSQPLKPQPETDNRREKLCTPAELSELNKKFASLHHSTNMRIEAYVDNRPVAEKVWEQQYRLQEWLKKHPEIKKQVEKEVKTACDSVELVIRRALAL
jgi:very-short-patch-repair endonuclease